MDIQFACPYCNQHLHMDSSKAGTAVRCPSCKGTMTVPAAPAAPAPTRSPQADAQVQSQAPSGEIFCPACGERNIANNFRCIRCGFILHGPTRPPSVTLDDSSLGGLIPYKNSHALLAYYFGIFSLVPCLGIPVGVAAVVLGIMGLKRATQHPEAKGKVHAWVGIILGGLCAAGNIVLVAVMPILLGISG